MAARPTRPRRGRPGGRGGATTSPALPRSHPASHTPTRSHHPQGRTRMRMSPVRGDPRRRPKQPTFSRGDGGYSLPRPQLPPLRLLAAPPPLYRVEHSFLAPPQRQRPAGFGTPLHISSPGTRAWAPVNEWVGVCMCTRFSPPLHSAPSHSPSLTKRTSPNYIYKY